jgi:hypothetical protein
MNRFTLKKTITIKKKEKESKVEVPDVKTHENGKENPKDEKPEEEKKG